MHRAHLDNSIELIGNLIFGSDVAPSILKTVRPSGQALVDDWDCLKTMVNIVCSSVFIYTIYFIKHDHVVTKNLRSKYSSCIVDHSLNMA